LALYKQNCGAIELPGRTWSPLRTVQLAARKRRGAVMHSFGALSAPMVLLSFRTKFEEWNALGAVEGGDAAAAANLFELSARAGVKWLLYFFNHQKRLLFFLVAPQATARFSRFLFSFSALIFLRICSSVLKASNSVST